MSRKESQQAADAGCQSGGEGEPECKPDGGQVGEHFVVFNQMVDQNFRADADQRQPAEHLHFLFVEAAEEPSAVHADKGEREGCQTDDDDRLENGDAQHREGNADGESVNAGRNGQHQKCRQVKRVFGALLFILRLHGLHNHVSADKQEQAEGYPVVHDRNKAV
ncbi:MAG: hypothetical protein MUC65_07635, partial [Pontiellaceae bacterium]|nr:hypothetical protein [Pontiellaceae bacterium]